MVKIQFLASLISAIVELVFFSGLIFGWSSINYVLKKEGYFSYLCDDSVNTSNALSNLSSVTQQESSLNSSTLTKCNTQDESLSLVFTISSFLLSVFTLPNGFIYDKFGTWVARIIAILLVSFGALLLSFSSADSSLLLFPAMCGFSIGGILLLVTNMQLGNLFIRFKSSIITLMNGSLDSSSVVFLLVKLAYDHGFTLNSIFQFLSCCTVFLWFRTFFLMPRTHVPDPLPNDGYKFGLHDCSTSKKKGENISEQELDVVDKQDKLGESDVAIEEMKTKTPSFVSCLLTTLFWMNVFHFSILQLRNYFFFISFNSWLASLLQNNSKELGAYVNVFGICQFFGIFCAPLNGMLIDGVKHRHKSYRDKGAINLLAISFSACITSCWGTLFSILLLIPAPKLQYISFVLQIAFRSFLYGGNASFIASAFPIKHFGKLYGMTMTLGGIISLLQFPLYSAVLRSFNGDFLVINIIFLVCCALTFTHPLFLYFKSKSSSDNNIEINEQFLVKNKISVDEKEG